jgi:hypothetical protein
VRRTRLAAWAIGALAAGAAGAAIGARSGGDTPGPRAAVDALPRPVTPAFTPGRPQPLRAGPYLSRWAPVRVAATARRRPDAHAAAVARVATLTPERTTNIVLILGRRADHAGRLWVRVRLATLPNGRTGWLPRSAVGGYGTVQTRLVVDLRLFTATLFRRGRRVFRARFAGQTYGPLAFGTSARSMHLTDWPDGGFIGIHGTDQPQLIPGRVSHGCIRMRNADIVALGRLMPIGTPLIIV